LTDSETAQKKPFCLFKCVLMGSILVLLAILFAGGYYLYERFLTLEVSTQNRIAQLEQSAKQKAPKRFSTAEGYLNTAQFFLSTQRYTQALYWIRQARSLLINESNQHTVLAQLDQEIELLSQIESKTDEAVLQLITQLESVLKQLTFKRALTRQTDTATKAVTDNVLATQAQENWQTKLQDSVNHIKNLITVKKHDQAPVLLMDDLQQEVIVGQIKLSFDLMRYALLKGAYAFFEERADALNTVIVTYFDANTPAFKQASDLLLQIRSYQPVVPPPEDLRSLALLKQAA